MRVSERQRQTSAQRRTVADHVAKRLTSDLVGYVGAAKMDVATVVDIYDWIRDGNVPAGEMHDISSVARKWDEYRNATHQVDWMRRAFGE
jgi:hypothetical protein